MQPLKAAQKNLVIVVASSFTHWKPWSSDGVKTSYLKSSHAKLFSTEKYLHAERIKHKVSNYMMIFKSSFCYSSPNFSKNMYTWAIVTNQTWPLRFTCCAFSSLWDSLKSLEFWKRGTGPPLHYFHRLDILWCNAEHNLQWSVLIRHITGAPPNPPNFEIWKFNYHSGSPDIQREQLAFQCFLR